MREQAWADHVRKLEVSRVGRNVLHARMTNWPSAASDVVAVQFTRTVVIVVGQREPDFIGDVVIDASEHRPGVQELLRGP
jgi:hypothetical protein